MNFDILIVDDNDLVRKGMGISLRGNGYSVLETSNVKEALKTLLSSDIEVSLIISDYRMPDIEGNEFVRLLKNNIKTKNIPIIIVSAEYSKEKKEAIKDLGASVWISKSEVGKKLHDSVRLILGK